MFAKKTDKFQVTKKPTEFDQLDHLLSTHPKFVSYYECFELLISQVTYLSA